MIRCDWIVSISHFNRLHTLITQIKCDLCLSCSLSGRPGPSFGIIAMILVILACLIACTSHVADGQQDRPLHGVRRQTGGMMAEQQENVVTVVMLNWERPQNIIKIGQPLLP